jgi:hypothetical protein
MVIPGVAAPLQLMEYPDIVEFDIAVMGVCAT